MPRATKRGGGVKIIKNEVDRLSHAKEFANELSESRLREIKESQAARWTSAKRAEKSAGIRNAKPWESSTGPRTPAGKAASAANVYNRGSDNPELQLIGAWLRMQDAYRKMVTMRRKGWPDDLSMLRKRMMTLEELLLQMKRALRYAGVDTASLDARLLMRQGGNFSDVDLITRAMCPLSPEVIENTLELLRRRLEGEPFSRIAGEREFWGLTFKVTPDTLDPRQDTETLVEAALKHARFLGRSPLKILDLGTGTGCIPISLLTELPHATAVAIDINPGAIETARENAVRHGVESRIEFRCGSWFGPLKEGESFDLILSNPPYIPESEIESLAKEVKNHDPILALSGGVDGLEAYKSILTEIKKHLACGGFALFEIGEGQEIDLARLVEKSNMTRGESYMDLGGILRVVEITHGEN